MMTLRSALNSSPLFRTIKPTLALGAAALGGQLQGAVIYNNFPDVTSGPDPDSFEYNGDATFSYVKFDLQNLTIAAGRGGTNIVTIGFYAYDNIQKKGGQINAQVQAYNANISQNFLLAGSQMDSSIPFQGGSVYLPSNAPSLYIGVRMASTVINYGWIHFSTGADSGAGGPLTITLLDAAFESTPGTGIQVGATTPEPATGALIALAGGAMAPPRRRAALAA